MMSMNEFANAIITIAGGNVEEINGRIGIVCPDNGNNIRSIVWVDDIYTNNESEIPQIAEFVADVWNNAVKTNVSLKLEDVINKITVRLVNPNNGNYDIFMPASKFSFNDLILVPYISEIIENGSLQINHNLLNYWNMGKEDVFEIGINNLTYDICKMSDILKPYLGDEDFFPPMYIITNEKKYHGASSVIPALTRLHEMFPNGFVIFPSSIHECIAVECGIYEVEELQEIVEWVNKTAVDPKDFLSNNVYIFKV